jgi:hypothetical protein
MHTHTHNKRETKTHMHTHIRACACIHLCIHLYRHWLGEMPTGVGAGKAKIFNYRVRGYLGLHLIFLKFGHRNEYGKVRYCEV